MIIAITIILGIDISKDMIELANKNKEEKAREFVRNTGDLDGYNKRTWFGEGNAYNLVNLVGGKESADYIICRNVLHRLREPEKALEQMLSVLKTGGKLYIRDLRRDACWNTVVNRIGEQRWEKPILVRDYIDAMASMLTKEELVDTLVSLGINEYEISDGDYRSRNESLLEKSIKEYERETEYVCVISKQLTFLINKRFIYL
ncbi:MAG: methyltransferase domain-containing protein [Nanoarchaeota archaeon]|nr:methyltransferase domain-containing protein [Nanoarchaeota archaeon]